MKTLEEQKEEFLAHAGVKGMKWGQRSKEIRTDRAAAKKELVSVEKDWKAVNKEFRREKDPVKKAKAQVKLNAIDDKYGEVFGRTIQSTRGEKIRFGASIAGVGALYAAGKWATANPDKMATIMAQGMNIIKNTKAIDVGYEVVKLGLKNGRWG